MTLTKEPRSKGNGFLQIIQKRGIPRSNDLGIGRVTSVASLASQVCSKMESPSVLVALGNKKIESGNAQRRRSCDQHINRSGAVPII